MLLASGRERVSVLLLAQFAIQVLTHGALYALSGYQEHCVPADVHAMVGYALEIMDYQGGSHPPLRSPATARRRVCYEVERLRVEEIHLIVLGLQAMGAVYVTVVEDVETLAENVVRSPGHLREGGLQVLVALCLGGFHERVADVFVQGPRAYQVVGH